jgi:hypothetical protein
MKKFKLSSRASNIVHGQRRTTHGILRSTIHMIKEDSAQFYDVVNYYVVQRTYSRVSINNLRLNSYVIKDAVRFDVLKEEEKKK